MDGTLSGKAGSIIMPQIVSNKAANMVYAEKFNVASTATLRSEWGAYVNEGSHFGLMRLDLEWGKDAPKLKMCTSHVVVPLYAKP
jgi:hypothetical protein